MLLDERNSLHSFTMLCGDLFSDACLAKSRVAQSCDEGWPGHLPHPVHPLQPVRHHCIQEVDVAAVLSQTGRENSRATDMQAFRELFAKAKHIVALSGAGISAESGVPTFRQGSVA